jgi:mannose-6-phosphate isomerase-like protein (cupin superfamily)
MKGVDFVIDFNDQDNSAKHAIWMVRQSYPQDKIIFANGGDRTDENIPEMDIVDDNIEFVFGVGGSNKKNSSSWILQEWKAPKTERPWGYYRVLHDTQGTKVKELTIEPGQGISLQRHAHRNEYWHISQGRAIAESYLTDGYKMPSVELNTHSNHKVPVGEWHRLYNPFDEIVKIIEIQYGDQCVEEDIERKL